MSQDPFDLVGDVIDGQFRVDAFAGEGDLSVVYKGYHKGVDAPVAIKCLNLPATLDPALVKPLVDDFREGSRLHYRLAQGNLNIAQSLASGTTLAPRTGQILPFLVREWFEGRSLAAYFAKRRAEGHGRLSFTEVFALMAPVADGLAYAHRQGVWHHSINPSNLFVVESGPQLTLKILDFGVARALNAKVLRPGHSPAVPVGLRVLLPGYAAPEQLDKLVGALGPWTDVYSFALVVLEALLGRPVLGGGEAAPAAHLDATNRPSPRNLGLALRREVSEVLEHAVALEPAGRPPNAEAFWRALEIAAGHRAAAKPPPPGPAPSAPSATGPTATARMVSAPRRPTAPPIASPPRKEPPGVPPAPPEALLESDERPTARFGSAPDVAVRASPKASSAEAPSSLSAPVQVAPAHFAAASLSAPSSAPVDLLSVEPLEEVGPARSARALWVRRATAAALVTATLSAGLWLLHRAPRSDAVPPAAPSASIPPASLASATTPMVTPSIPLAVSTSPLPPAARDPAPPATARPSAAAVRVTSPSAVATLSPKPAHGLAKRFTRGLAVPGLDAIAAHLKTCQRRGGPRGPGSIRITFESSGREVHIMIGPPYRGTGEGACIVDRFRQAHVQPFQGSFGAVNYVFDPR